MQAYIVRRTLLSGISLLGLSIVVFIFLRAVPGDVAVLILGNDSGASSQQTAKLRHSLGLDDPMPVQYAHWAGDVVRGDLGKSLLTARPVSGEIGNRISTTLELSLLSLGVGLLLGISTGTVAAVQRGRLPDQVLRMLAVIGLAVPNFWIGTMVIVFGARWFGWIPPVNHVEIWQHPLANLEQFAVPAAIIGASLGAALSRMTRSAVLDVLHEDFVRTARAKGLSAQAVLVRHALKPGLIPVITLFSIQVGTVVAGTVIVERVFSLPGLGRLIVDAIGHKDYPVVQGIILLYGSFIVLTNLLTDLMYSAIDPRVRLA